MCLDLKDLLNQLLLYNHSHFFLKLFKATPSIVNWEFDYLLQFTDFFQIDSTQYIDNWLRCFIAVHLLHFVNNPITHDKFNLYYHTDFVHIAIDNSNRIRRYFLDELVYRGNILAGAEQRLIHFINSLRLVAH